MLGNLIRECGVIGKSFLHHWRSIFRYYYSIYSSCYWINYSAENFVNVQTLKIVVLGLIAFCCGSASGVLWARLMCKMSGGKINPLIGSAGIAAVPMAARVSHNVGLQYNKRNYLIMHAMGPNLAGVLGTAVAGGIMLTLLGVM